MNVSEKWNIYGEWRLMETMRTTQAIIPMLNGILLLQSGIYGKPDVFCMDYKVNILVHILNRSNFGWLVTYMGKGRVKWEFHGHLARFPYIYDIYDTKHGDSMTIMTQIKYEGWNITCMTF